MKEAASDTTSRAPPTTLGPAPEDPDEVVTLPEAALRSGCYIEGAETHEQTALLHSWCVEWAEAGHGFCYVHPRGPEPWELLARLPEDRLEDVVWIDIDRSNISPQLDVPAIERVAIDPLEAPPSRFDYTVDSIRLRVNAILDAYASDERTFDWPTAVLLQTYLPEILRNETLSDTDVAMALDQVNLRGTTAPAKNLVPRKAIGMETYPLELVDDREGRAFRQAASLLREPFDPYGGNPLIGDATYDPADAIENDAILLVTGALAPSNGAFQGVDHPIGTHLLVAEVCARLWEGANLADTETPTFPLVLDGFAEFTTGDGDLYQKLLKHAGETPLAPVFSGPPAKTLPKPIHIAIGDHVDTRLVLAPPGGLEADRHDHAAALRDALHTGSVDAVEYYLEREHSSSIAEASLAWLRTGTAGRLAGLSDVQQTMQPAIVPGMPTTRHDRERVARAITRSIDRHGAIWDGMTEEMKRRARDRFEDRHQRR